MDEPVQRQDRTHPNYELNKFLHEALLMLDDRLHRGRLWVYRAREVDTENNF